MTESEELILPKVRRFRFDWIFPILFRPRRTLEQVTSLHYGAWLAPLLLLTVLALAQAVISGGAKQAAVQTGQVEPPADFQYWTPEQQQQYFEGQATYSGPLFTTVFPAAAAFAQVWVEWIVLGGVLYLALTMSGSRGGMPQALNLAAWSSVPLALRHLVQIASVVLTNTTIRAQGLSGFAPAGSAFLTALLALFDLYFFWQFILLVIGARGGTGLSAVKATTAVLISFLIAWALFALPGFLLNQLSGLSFIRPFLF